MAKDLPYFKFFVSEWNDGDISLESYHLQGLFISVCSFYWSKECELSYDKLCKKFNGSEQELIELADLQIIKINEGVVKINFLDEQKEERIKSSKKKSKGGKASAEARRLKKLTENEQLLNSCSTENEQLLNSCSTESQVLRKEKIREEKKREEKIIPDFEEFKNYSITKKPEGFNLCLVKLESKYNAWKENNWKDGNDKEIKNWKSKIINTIPYLEGKNNDLDKNGLTKKQQTWLRYGYSPEWIKENRKA